MNVLLDDALQTSITDVAEVKEMQQVSPPASAQLSLSLPADNAQLGLAVGVASPCLPCSLWGSSF
jgi:hypothetical protein